MKRCPIAAKIAGSIGIMPCCALNDFSHRGMNVCRICEASLSHYTLYMGNLGPPRIQCIPVAKNKQKMAEQNTKNK